METLEFCNLDVDICTYREPKMRWTFWTRYENRVLSEFSFSLSFFCIYQQMKEELVDNSFRWFKGIL